MSTPTCERGICAQLLNPGADRGVEPVGIQALHHRRTADSDGVAAVIPNVTSTSTGRSAAHSVIVTDERAPAATAHTATDSSATSP